MKSHEEGKKVVENTWGRREVRQFFGSKIQGDQKVCVRLKNNPYKIDVLKMVVTEYIRKVDPCYIEHGLGEHSSACL
jgi:hypothetical protein